MRNKLAVTNDNVYLGMRVKIGLPKVWCQVNHNSNTLWLKGKVTRIDYSKKEPEKIIAITINARWKKHHYYFKVENMWCHVDNNGVYKSIYKCL